MSPVTADNLGHKRVVYLPPKGTRTPVLAVENQIDRQANDQ
jgi:hypothetical protein